MRLSKSRFTSGPQCHRRLWWEVHEPDAGGLVPDVVRQAVFDQGTRVGALARTCVPGGRLVDLPHDAYGNRISMTAELLDERAPAIYEATSEIWRRRSTSILVSGTCSATSTATSSKGTGWSGSRRICRRRRNAWTMRSAPFCNGYDRGGYRNKNARGSNATAFSDGSTQRTAARYALSAETLRMKVSLRSIRRVGSSSPW